MMNVSLNNMLRLILLNYTVESFIWLLTTEAVPVFLSIMFMRSAFLLKMNPLMSGRYFSHVMRYNQWLIITLTVQHHLHAMTEIQQGRTDELPSVNNYLHSKVSR